MVLRGKDINPFGTQKTVSMDFDEDKRREGRQGNFKKVLSFNSLVVANKWLKYCRYGAKQSINQSMYRLVNYSINSPSVDNFFNFMKSQVNANELITEYL